MLLIPAIRGRVGGPVFLQQSIPQFQACRELSYMAVPLTLINRRLL